MRESMRRVQMSTKKSGRVPDRIFLRLDVMNYFYVQNELYEPGETGIAGKETAG